MRRLRKKFKRHRMGWSTALIEEEKGLLKEFGLNRKKEILRARETLRQYRRRARELIAVGNKEKEKVLIEKLVKLGILENNSGLDDVLALTVNDILKRRLQTIVFKKGIGKTIKDARQRITHGHIFIGDKKNRYPSYMVLVEEERKIKVKG